MSRFRLDAYAAIQRAQTELARFTASTFRFRDEKLNTAVHRTIQEFGLLAPPVVEATFPFEVPRDQPRTTAELGACGLCHEALPGLLATARGEGAWPTDRPLYRHQVDAMRHYSEGRSLAVASGTGSGKTECFLFPALDALLRDSDLDQPGVRVLVVYPLNALVNNQMDRLRDILGAQRDIRFGLYTSRLPQTQREAERVMLRKGIARCPAEVISREELRTRPPHLLVTNFSMLEYALVRPADAPLFSSQFARPRLLVLDEAHVYAGAMAAEITMLLRRAWLRWGIDDPRAVQGIATSATMQQGLQDGSLRLQRFAADLLSKDLANVHVIEGRRVLPTEDGAEIDAAVPTAKALVDVDAGFRCVSDTGDTGKSVVLDDSEPSRKAALELLSQLAPGSHGEGTQQPAARLLWNGFQRLSWVRQLKRRLLVRPERVDVLADGMFSSEPDAPMRNRAMHRLLDILSMAQTEAQSPPLLPARVHAVARGPHGIFACVNADCTQGALPGALGMLHPDHTTRCMCGSAVYELRVCESCGQSFLLGREGSDEEDLPALLPADKTARVDLLAFRDTWDDGAPFEEGEAGGRRITIFLNGRIGGPRPLRAFEGGWLVGPTNSLHGVACPRCKTQHPRRAVIRRIELGTDATLQVLVDGVYPDLPQHERTARGWLRGGGRRLLLFADNRQVAASLAAKIEETHDTLLARRIIVESLRTALDGGAAHPDLERDEKAILEAVRAKDMARATELQHQLEVRQASLGGPLASCQRLEREIADHQKLPELSSYDEAAVAELATMILARELGRRPSRGGNLEAGGVIVVDYSPHAPPRPEHPDLRAVFTDGEWAELVRILLDTARSDAIGRLPALGIYADFVPKWTSGKSLVKSTRALGNGDTDLEAWVEEEPALADGQATVGFTPGAAGASNRRLEYVAKVLARRRCPPTITANIALDEAWRSIVKLSGIDGSSIRAKSLDQPEHLEIPLRLLRFRLAQGGRLWRCPLCKTNWARQVDLICPTRHCDGDLEAVGSVPDVDDRLVATSAGLELFPALGLTTHEHTAQIQPEDLEEVERRFKRGEVNALVCSTTMELGIDIGGLSATVLTNVPPSASNYLQRAGRAGRRTEGTSLVLTFARPRPFDQAAFAQPEKPFTDRITPPVVKLDSPRIVERHINAFLLSHFFRRYRATDDVRSPLASLRTVGAFLDQSIRSVQGFGPEILGELERTLGVVTDQHTMCDAFVTWLDLIADAGTMDSAQPEQRVRIGAQALTRGTALSGLEFAELVALAQERVGRIAAEVRAQVSFLRREMAEEQAAPEGERDDGRLRALELQLDDLVAEELLGFLAESQFLPRYGFPIAIVPLIDSHRNKSSERGSGSDTPERPNLRLDRDAALALNEYSPGAEVVAGKYIHTSRGLLRHWTGEDAPGVLAARFMGICQSCGQVQYGRTEADIVAPCPTCREGNPRSIRVVRPKLGFAVQWGERPRRWVTGTRTTTRPVTEAAYAARRGAEHACEVSTGLALAYDEEGQVIVRSEGALVQTNTTEVAPPTTGAPRPKEGYGYAICYLCGRAEPEQRPASGNPDKPIPLPPQLRQHRRLRGFKRCEANGHYWRHAILADAVRTETLRLSLRGPAAFPAGPPGRQLATTLMVALQLSAGEVLGLDSRAVGGLLAPTPRAGGAGYDVVLYDAVAGGAGHCRELLERWRDLLEATRRRLDCPNERCTGACHRCLLAFETQRYELVLARAALREFLEPRWPHLMDQPERGGFPVAPLMRSGAQLSEILARQPAAAVVLAVPDIDVQATDQAGWLRKLLHHAMGDGSVALAIERLPDPNVDDERVLCRALQAAIDSSSLELYRVKPGTIQQLGFRMVTAHPDGAYAIEGDDVLDGLGPNWLANEGEEGPTRIFEAKTDAGRRAAKASLQALLIPANRVDPATLNPSAPPESVVIRDVPAMASGDAARFEHWFRNGRAQPLWQTGPLKCLSIQDPYLWNEWQLSLLAEVIDLFKGAKCRKIVINTHPPRDDDGFGSKNISAQEQLARIQRMLGNASWRPVPVPTGAEKRAGKRTMHQRFIEGEREDGSKFLILLERGLDFIESRWEPRRREHVRTTRASYLVVKDPA